jgi:catechol 2,3-dioxygenase-like lactoylglutathione lyase family enzyme
VEVLSSRTIVHPADLDRSIEFYRDILGLAVAREFGQGEGRGIVFFAGGGLIEVVAGWRSARSPGPVAPVTPPIALWLQVRSVETALAELQQRGVPVVRPARLEPWGLIEAWIDDPDGLRIHLVEVPPDHPLRRDSRRVETGDGP